MWCTTSEWEGRGGEGRVEGAGRGERDQADWKGGGRGREGKEILYHASHYKLE